VLQVEKVVEYGRFSFAKHKSFLILSG